MALTSVESTRGQSVNKTSPPPANSMIIGRLGGVDKRPGLAEKLNLGCACRCKCGDHYSENEAVDNSAFQNVGGPYILAGWC